MATRKSCFVKTSKQSATQRIHERKMYTIGKNNTNVLDQLISAHRATAASKLKALRDIFNAVLLYGRQGIALRGRTDEFSNF